MMASLRIIVLALFALSTTTVAFAADAGFAPMPPDTDTSDAASDAAESDASDVGPESDAMESDVMESDAMDSDAMESDVMDSDVMESDVMESDVMESDAMESDVMDSDVMDSDVMEPPSGQFTESECWDEECPAEVEACQASPDCVAYNACVLSSADGNALQACLQGLVDELGEEAVDAAGALYNAIQQCGLERLRDDRGHLRWNLRSLQRRDGLQLRL